MLRVLDQPEVKNPLELPILNMPPEFFLRIAWPSLMLQDDFAKSPFTDALRDSLKREGVTAPQLARALSAHVLELEKATFVNSGTPFESIMRSPGASTFYDATIPCADQPDKPLTLRIERTTQQMGTQSNFASFAPWLIEEAKKQSKEPLGAAVKGEAKEMSPDAFHTTRWTLVRHATGHSAEGQQALSELCAAYYEPIVAFLRRSGRDADAAREMAHEFFAHVLEKPNLDGAEPGRGRFRSYLLGALKHHLSQSARTRRPAKARRWRGDDPARSRHRHFAWSRSGRSANAAAGSRIRPPMGAAHSAPRHRCARDRMA